MLHLYTKTSNGRTECFLSDQNDTTNDLKVTVIFADDFISKRQAINKAMQICLSNDFNLNKIKQIGTVPVFNEN